MSYLDKYKGDGDRRSIYDILSLDPNNKSQWENDIKPNYVADGIDQVVIGGNTFTNYGDFQFAWEKSYVKSPERSADGSIGNLNSYATFNTPHLIINFGLMSIDDYRKIMRLDLESNEFIVKCYDPIYNRTFKGKMYFATPQMAKLFKLAKIRFDGERWEEFVELVGVQEYTVELIGTNSDMDLVSVRYLVNPPVADMESSVTDGGEDDVYKGEEVIIGSNTDIPTETFGGTYKFRHWEDENGQKYIDGYAYTINDNLVLYAQWEAMTNYTLVFNYGLADEISSKNPEQYPTKRTVVFGKSIGEIPVAPYIEVEGEYLSPYENGAWYTTPTKADNSVPVKSEDVYWLRRDSTIYLLYDTKGYKFTLKISSEQGESGIYLFDIYQENNGVKYGTPLNLPNLVKNGYTFDGWYTFSDFREGTKYTQTTMPAHNLTLYARWVEE